MSAAERENILDVATCCPEHSPREGREAEESEKPILCLDFDGVVHSYTSGWVAANWTQDPPVRGAHEFLRAAVEHFDVAIFSSRSHQPGGVQAMRNFCGFYFPDVVERLRFPTRKPPAKVSIDDRAFTFRGRWPGMDELLNFEPYREGAE